MSSHPNEPGLLRLKDVLALYPVSKTAWYAGIASGLYPRPLKLSTRVSAWSRCDVISLIESTVAAGGAQ
jgi:predicted DNA-binding transcriptional regulator AlpA